MALAAETQRRSRVRDCGCPEDAQQNPAPENRSTLASLSTESTASITRHSGRADGRATSWFDTGGSPQRHIETWPRATSRDCYRAGVMSAIPVVADHGDLGEQISPAR